MANPPSIRFLLAHPAHLVACGFGSGLSPLAPGTMGTLFAWASFPLLRLWLSDFEIIGLLVVCFVELVIYLRVRVAIGGFSLQLDPTDKPFRLFRLTDSLLGYMLLSFLFCVSLYVMLTQLATSLAKDPASLLGIVAGVFLLTLLAEQLTLKKAAGKIRS